MTDIPILLHKNSYDLYKSFLTCQALASVHIKVKVFCLQSVFCISVICSKVSFYNIG